MGRPLAGFCATAPIIMGAAVSGRRDPLPGGGLPKAGLGPPSRHSRRLLAGLMGRAVPPERHSPHHLKEQQHHIRGSITQGTACAGTPGSHSWSQSQRGEGWGGTPQGRRSSHWGRGPGQARDEGLGRRRTRAWAGAGQACAQVGMGSRGASYSKIKRAECHLPPRWTPLSGPHSGWC